MALDLGDSSFPYTEDDLAEWDHLGAANRKRIRELEAQMDEAVGDTKIGAYFGTAEERRVHEPTKEPSVPIAALTALDIFDGAVGIRGPNEEKIQVTNIVEEVWKREYKAPKKGFFSRIGSYIHSLCWLPNPEAKEQKLKKNASNAVMRYLAYGDQYHLEVTKQKSPEGIDYFTFRVSS